MTTTWISDSPTDRFLSTTNLEKISLAISGEVSSKNPNPNAVAITMAASTVILPQQRLMSTSATISQCKSCLISRASIARLGVFGSQWTSSPSTSRKAVSLQPRDNRLQFRMHRFRCAVAKPVQVEDGSQNAQDDGNKQGEDAEEDDYPMWMEEDDPTWPEGEDDGYGFQVSQFFEKWGNVKVKNVDEDGKVIENDKGTDDEDDDLSLKWEEEEEQWIVREINFLEWDLVALQDPTPLIVLGFERYGSSGTNGWALLKELETMLKRIIDSRKYPVRAVKLDVNIEQDLAAALKIKTVPTLLFIKAGKMVYRMTGVKSADELLLITSHLFYHSTRPVCMDDDKTSESVTNLR